MYIELLRSILRGAPRRSEPRRKWGRATVMSLLAVGLIVGTVYAGAPLDKSRPAAGQTPVLGAPLPAGDADQVEDLETRVRRVSDAWAEAADYYRNEVAPIRRVLLRYRDDPALAEHVAVALVREANRAGLEPRLLLAVLLVENPWLDPTIRSSVGAIGLMQVMPVHRGAWPSCGADLEDVDANICHGARIFAHYFRLSDGNVERALLRYNGCVHGTNTPTCSQYPYQVFARAGRASVLAWVGTGPAAASR